MPEPEPPTVREFADRATLWQARLSASGSLVMVMGINRRPCRGQGKPCPTVGAASSAPTEKRLPRPVMPMVITSDPLADDRARSEARGPACGTRRRAGGAELSAAAFRNQIHFG